jgi:hypothetical protein
MESEGLERQPELGPALSLLLGCVLGLVLCAFAWLNAVVWQWGSGQLLWLSVAGQLGTFGLTAASAYLSARVVSLVRPDLWMLAMPVIAATMASYAWVAINMTMFGSKGGVVFVLVLGVVLSRER